MDGNGRWAKAQSLPRLKGHNKGANIILDIVKSAPAMGVDYITLYAFSTENWKRPKSEVSSLMDLLRSFLKKNRQELLDNNVRLRLIGDITRFEPDIQDKMLALQNDTQNCTGITMILALNYGGRDDIVRAVRTLSSKMDMGNISESDISNALDTSGIPDPDMIIRTAGEKRLSNFLIWQSAYTEFIFVDKAWPEFSPQDLQHAVCEYQSRVRNFGGLPSSYDASD